MSNEVYSGITKELHALKMSILALPSQFKLLLDQYHHSDAELNLVLISENQLFNRYDEISSKITTSTQTETQTSLAIPQDEPNRYNQSEAMRSLKMSNPLLSQGWSVRNQFQSKRVTYNGPMQKTFHSLSKSVENSGNLLRRSQKALNTGRLASGVGSHLDNDHGRGGNGKIRPCAGPAPLPASVSVSGIETALRRILTAIEQGSYELLRSGECISELKDIHLALDELLDMVGGINGGLEES